MKTKLICRSALLTIVIAACSGHVFAQTEQQKLTATILHLDSAFWNAYNHCDTLRFKNFVTNDVEFYHDKGGITTGAETLIQSLNKNLCSNPDYRLRREAVVGTVKVYPMKNNKEIYGAVINGDHVFYITQNGKPEYLDGAASFTHLWLLKNKEWKMKRIISYDHHPAAYENTRKETKLTDKQLHQLAGTYKSAQSGTMNVLRQRTYTKSR